MTITADYQVWINDTNHVVFRHPYDDKAAFNFLSNNLNKSEVIKVLTSEFGLSAKTAVNQHKDWLVNNYEGIKLLVNDYSLMYDFRVPKSVIDSLK
jgi:hypothetical protein